MCPLDSLWAKFGSLWLLRESQVGLWGAFARWLLGFLGCLRGLRWPIPGASSCDRNYDDYINYLELIVLASAPQEWFFAFYGRWEVLDAGKILPRGVGTICPHFWEITFPPTNMCCSPFLVIMACVLQCVTFLYVSDKAPQRLCEMDWAQWTNIWNPLTSLSVELVGTPLQWHSPTNSTLNYDSKPPGCKPPTCHIAFWTLRHCNRLVEGHRLPRHSPTQPATGRHRTPQDATTRHRLANIPSPTTPMKIHENQW